MVLCITQYMEKISEMNCWHCGTELIWGGEHDVEDNEDYDIVSNLSCPKCNAYLLSGL